MFPFSGRHVEDVEALVYALVFGLLSFFGLGSAPRG
jgi:hypothetical protein